jgi:choline dehydrogenase-like flavoprotein
MILDGRTIASGTTVRADLCIVGAGAAGITIAREFIGHSGRVVLLESGGTTVREETQSLCRGDVTGHPYYPLHICRRRVLGGSTSFWGGWCRPLDNIDFEERAWVAYSGWPFTKEHLKREYARAHTICKLGNYGYDCGTRRFGGCELLVDPTQSGFEDILFHICAVRFGETYRAELKRARNLDLLLYANAFEIEMDRDHKAALSVQVATLAGNRFIVSARNFVLAAGGIENPRILLGSRGTRPSGVGNESDLVGRFFADHLHLRLRTVILRDRRLPSFYHLRKIGGVALRGGMALTADIRHRNKLLGFAITFHNADDPHDVVYPAYENLGYSSLQALAKPLMRAEPPDRFGYHFRTMFRHLDNAATLSFRKLIKPRWQAVVVGCRAEQTPNRSSRVLLDHERDALGMNKVRLDWRLTEQDLDSLRRTQQILDNELNFPDNGEHAINIIGAAHHIGTTRMHRDPKLGVVDENCRVHGIRNLFIAGSSVFPTAGWAPPTLTIVALALRLADLLKQSQR